MIRALALLVLLAGCAAQGQSAAQIRAGLTPAQLARAPGPVLLADIPDAGLAATLQIAGTANGVETWRSAGNQTLSFRSGVLVATRGLGDDLMGADVTGTLAALRGAGQADYPRLLSYLDGEDRTLLRAMTCTMAPPVSATVPGIARSFPTVLRAETCHTTGLTVRNRYWQDQDGTMRRAEQWIGPGIGMLVTERLTD
ncbi:MAG: YjbF family lipoprotein [Rubellimicrobium sp.]|nr:YjbF family lipoprotein [Rubellimicrobium sp.]